MKKNFKVDFTKFHLRKWPKKNSKRLKGSDEIDLISQSQNYYDLIIQKNEKSFFAKFFYKKSCSKNFQLQLPLLFIYLIIYFF